MANSPITRQRPNQKSLRRTIGLMGTEPAQRSGDAWVGELGMYEKQKPAGLIMSRVKVPLIVGAFRALAGSGA
jgi:hypothetical protein